LSIVFIKVYGKNADGNWKRNEKMWDGNKNTGFTPKKPIN